VGTAFSGERPLFVYDRRELHLAATAAESWGGEEETTMGNE